MSPGPRHAVALLLIAVGVAGCSGGDGDDEAAVAVETSAQRGPVAVTVRAERDVIEVGEKLSVAVEVVFEPGVEVTMPVFDDGLGSFAVRAVDTPPDTPATDGGTARRWVHTWVVDTFSAGPAEVPPITVVFTDARTDEATEGSIVTESLAIEVRSVLAGDEGEADFRDIRSALEVNVPGAGPEWMIGGAIALVGVLAAVILALRARRTLAIEEVAPQPPAHVWALRMLAALEADDLIGAGDAETFYTRLSGIVREYIERRFGIMAPERTTEEFLREAGRSAALEEHHKALLAGFLRAADMVKFARHVPTADECQAAFDAARGFVDQTAPVGAPGEVAA
jgi:hypothetical protein